MINMGQCSIRNKFLPLLALSSAKNVYVNKMLDEYHGRKKLNKKIEQCMETAIHQSLILLGNILKQIIGKLFMGYIIAVIVSLQE